jgi:hypothetical protein
MKKRGIFKNDTFISKKVPNGPEKVFVSKINIKQIFHSILAPTFLVFATFSWGGLFRAMGYLFGYKSVVSEDIPLFHVWGTIIDPKICWESKFGSVNLLNCKLGFLPFYFFSGLYGLFT